MNRLLHTIIHVALCIGGCRGFAPHAPQSVGLRSFATLTTQNRVRTPNLVGFGKVDGEEEVGSLWDPSSDSRIASNRLSMAIMAVEDVLSPAQEFLDEKSGGWALGYADLSPESSSTRIGQAFLATNIAYAATGILLSMQGEIFLGLLTEFTSVASFIYHYTQLEAGVEKVKDRTVRLALMVDYVFAFGAIFVAGIYVLTGESLPPIEGILSGGIGLAFLFSCWVWEAGTPYIVLHSLWHLFSAYAGFIVGSAHVA